MGGETVTRLSNGYVFLYYLSNENIFLDPTQTRFAKKDFLQITVGKDRKQWPMLTFLNEF